ncbi:MAG: collagen binding domain-containing protein [Bulleidia sp.]
MKRNPLLLTAGLMTMAVLPLQGKGGDPLPLHLETDTAGFIYGLYEDEGCQLPLLNEDDEPVILKSDEEGILTPLMDPPEETVYLRQISSVTGYHVDPQVYCMDGSLQTLPVYPIEVSVDTEQLETGTFRIENEQEEIVLEWSLEDCENPSVEEIGSLLDVGNTYVLKRMDTDEWALHREVPFTIPLTPEKTELKVPVIVYGRLSVNWEKPLPENGVFGLFEKQDDEEPVRDVFERPVIMDLHEQSEWSFPLLQGNYVLKEMECDEHCIDSPVCEVKITERQTTELSLYKEFLKTVIRLCNGDGKLLEGTILVEDEEGSQETLQSGQELILAKDTSYVITPTDIASGYYIPDSTTLRTGQSQVEPFEIMATPFHVTFFNRDRTTGSPLSGGQFVIEDLSGTQIGLINGNTEGTPLSDLHCGTTYRIHQVRKTDMYTPMEDVIFAIAEKGDPEVVINGYSTGYVRLVASASDDQGNVITDSLLKVWTDASCTQQALDIHGLPIQGTGSINADVPDGTYHVSAESMPQSYYRIPSSVPVVCDHVHSVHSLASLQTAEADFLIRIQDQDGNDLEGFSVTVRKEGRTVGTLKNDAVSARGQGMAVLAGGTYSLKLKGDENHYIFDTEEKTIEIPLYQPEETLTTVYTATPYVSFTLVSTDVQAETSYELYTDVSCAEKAVSVRQTGDSRMWNLYDGTYYLRQTSIHPAWYENSEVYRVDLDHTRSWKESRRVMESPVTVNLMCMDEEGNTVEGAMYEIMDMNENTLETVVIGTGNAVLQGSWLHRGTSYIIRQIRSAEGYDTSADVVFTVPQNRPSTTPNVTLPQQKKETINLNRLKENKPEKQVRKQNHPEEIKEQEPESDHGIRAGIGIGAVVLCSCIVLLKLFTGKKM